jgi:hypothetical protein
MNWKHIAKLIGVGLLFVVIDVKTKGKIRSVLASIPVIGPFLGS